jgi:hypothetical protein
VRSLVLSCLFFLTKYDENSQYVILNIRFEIQEFYIIFFLIGCEQGVVIAKYYDRRLLYPMFLKSYHHLHPLSKAKKVLLLMKKK